MIKIERDKKQIEVRVEGDLQLVLPELHTGIKTVCTSLAKILDISPSSLLEALYVAVKADIEDNLDIGAISVLLGKLLESRHEKGAKASNDNN